MNEGLKRALKQVGRYWHVCGHTLPNSEERYWETIWPAIERWHEGEVGRLTWERDGARGDRDTALEDNKRLREEIDSLKAIKEDDYKEIEALREKLTGAREEIAAMRAANTDHQQQVRAPAELVADLESWLRANTGVVDTTVPGTVAELMGRIVMRWHNREVAALRARDAVRDENERLRFAGDKLAQDADAVAWLLRHQGEVNVPELERYVKAWREVTEAHAEPHPEAPKLEPRLPLCTRCGKPMLPGTNVGHRVQADGTITPHHWFMCPPEGAQR